MDTLLLVSSHFKCAAFEYLRCLKGALFHWLIVFVFFLLFSNAIGTVKYIERFELSDGV